ncbi:hypothetical protein C2S53_013460 [Perilla frutescens var. hirtella]|uniref:UDP-rhamnose:rhamnosyltransferase 1 n=1 Tax=Perilla frutescens var. hirtella TaxID=608512 RepID=A0AAD4IME4_PERFH|nr:hypothetical protein C2S53_013460 [Perilla frutescens var. hirtella]
MGGKGEAHVVMLPWLAFGHMIPFLELSIALAKSGTVHVSFLSTPTNIQRLIPKLPPNLSKLIRFISLPLPNPASNPLPENAEATVDVPPDKIDALKIAYDLMQEPIKNFIAEASPDWIIVDFFPHWAVDIAQAFSIPLIFYSMFTCSTDVFFGPPEYLSGEGQKQFRSSAETMTTPPHWVDFPSKVVYTIQEATGAQFGFYGRNKSGISDSKRLARVIEGSQAIAIRTCPEFEGDYLKLYSKITGKPVIPVGLLPPEKPSAESAKQEPWIKVFKWLDQQKSRSVIFVGFGSETKLSEVEIHEIAYGVELSGLPFVWALRADLDALPSGFCRRTAVQGVVQVGWAPQREILAHPSVGGSFFHAGWGSIIEALQFGHILVFLPLIIDQPLNARMMEEKELGIEVERAEDGSLSRNNIASALKGAMLSDQLRARARLVADQVFGNYDLHRSYAQQFAEYLKRDNS